MRRLPGVDVVDVPGARGDGLPPMDVPLFVGFAERGPLHRPVRLEDAGQFEAVFGRRFELLTAADGRAVPAHLPAAVQAFFAGGGRRCHVLRVAGAGAATTRWRVPGLRLARRTAGGWALQPPEEGPWLAAGSPGSWADRLQLAACLRGQTLRLGDPVAAGDVLRVHVPGTAAEGFVAVRAALGVQAALEAGPVLWRVEPSPPAMPLAVERIVVDLALREAAQPERGIPARQWRREACGLAPGAASLPWTEPDALARLETDPLALGAAQAWPLAGDPALGDDWMIVPEGLGAAFGPWAAADTGDADPLQRNGLERFDAGLFVDPAWQPGLTGAALQAWADQWRYFGTTTRRLRGLHAALGWHGEEVREATWLAVPDAVHLGWESEPLPGAFEAALVLAAPVQPARDPAAFDLCSPPVCPPAAPQWQWPEAAVQVSAGVPWHLSLVAASPPGPESRVEIELAARADFADARPLTATPYAADPTLAVPGVLPVRLPVGLHFLRARTWETHGEQRLASPWSAPVSLLARAPARRLHPAPAAGADSVVGTVHAALIDLAATTREHFALLSVPADWREAEVARHVQALRAHLARRDERAQAASFAALHHPWLLQAVPLAAQAEPGRSTRASLTEAHPPEGALLAQYALRTRTRGAWSAAGLEPLVWAVGVAGRGDPALLEAAGANAVEPRTRGIAATRAWTLDGDEDWQALGVRRLFILLRALARREGERFAFEPNDGALRRSLERGFDQLLARLMQRGAFRGERASQAYALRTASGRELALEIEHGRCSLEIRVAPSRPLRFLTLYVVRSGEQWRIEEGG